MIHTVGEKVIYKDKYEGIITTRRPANNSPEAWYTIDFNTSIDDFNSKTVMVYGDDDFVTKK